MHAVVKRLAVKLAASAAVFIMSHAGAVAGVYYEGFTETTIDPDSNSRATRAAIQGWVEDDNGKQLFSPDGGSAQSAEFWLVTRDGGETISVVNPDAGTYSFLSMDDLKERIADSLSGLDAHADVSFQGPTVKKLLEEAGPDMLDYATVHAVYQSAYKIVINVAGATQEIETSTRQEYWTTDTVDAAGMMWPEGGSPALGVPGLDAIIDQQRVSGFMLKSVVETTTTVQGHASTTRVVTELTRLEERDIDDAVFTIPSDYKQLATPTLPVPTSPYQQ